MITAARKLHLIEAVMKLKSEKTFAQIEQILLSTQAPLPSSRPSAREFLGIISKEDIELMENAINEGCEQINPDDWK